MEGHFKKKKKAEEQMDTSLIFPDASWMTWQKL